MWFKRIFRPPALKQVAPIVRPKVPFRRGYSLAEFRANPHLTEECRKFFHETALGGHILAVLHNSIPLGRDTEAVAVQLGQIRGHLNAIGIIEVMCVPMQEEVTPEVDYGASDIPDDQL